MSVSSGVEVSDRLPSRDITMAPPPHGGAAVAVRVWLEREVDAAAHVAGEAASRADALHVVGSPRRLRTGSVLVPACALTFDSRYMQLIVQGVYGIRTSSAHPPVPPSLQPGAWPASIDSRCKAAPVFPAQRSPSEPRGGIPE